LQFGSHDCRAPASLANYFQYPVTFIVPVGVVLSLAAIWFLIATHSRSSISIFLPLSIFYAGWCLLGTLPTCCPHYRSRRDITLSRALSGPHTLAVGLAWWAFGMALAVAYVAFVYGKFRGKVILDAGHH